jgi:hypothetical protein
MNSDKDAPPIRIIVADGEEDVTIKVLVCGIMYNQLLVNNIGLTSGNTVLLVELPTDICPIHEFML